MQDAANSESTNGHSNSNLMERIPVSQYSSTMEGFFHYVCEHAELEKGEGY